MDVAKTGESFRQWYDAQGEGLATLYSDPGQSSDQIFRTSGTSAAGSDAGRRTAAATTTTTMTTTTTKTTTTTTTATATATTSTTTPPINRRDRCPS
eukprot:9473937-Pyramimonas_sp.AAC.1